MKCNVRNMLKWSISILALVIFLLITCYPFLLMVMGSFKEDYEIFSITQSLLPRKGFDFEMYRKLFADWPFLRSMLNSVFVALATTVLTCFFCTIAGYTFSKFDFPYKNALFMIMLASLMIPQVATLVPSYLMIRKMGGVNHYWPLIVPGAIPAFGVFMIRQFADKGLPVDVLEYARVEGASEWFILRKIVFPMLRPGIFSLAILTFMNTWNDFLWPIIITSKKEMLTVTALLRSIGDSSMNGGTGILLAATTLSTFPILILYFLFHKQLVSGILEGSSKG